MFGIGVRVVATFLVIVLLVLGVGWLMPRQYSFSQEIVVDAPPEKIFPMLYSLRNWQAWSTWNSEKHPEWNITYSGRHRGVGATQTWEDTRGFGKLWISDIERDAKIEYCVEFQDFPKMTSTFHLIADDTTKTRVRWSSTGNLPSGPFYGWFGWFYSSMMKQQYLTDLTKLKQVVEDEAASAVEEPPPGRKELNAGIRMVP